MMDGRAAKRRGIWARRLYLCYNGATIGCHNAGGQQMRNKTDWMTGKGIGLAPARLLLILVAMIAAGILAAACDGAGPQSPAATIPPATPNLEATVAAMVAASIPAPTPTATAIPTLTPATPNLTAMPGPGNGAVALVWTPVCTASVCIRRGLRGSYGDAPDCVDSISKSTAATS